MEKVQQCLGDVKVRLGQTEEGNLDFQERSIGKTGSATVCVCVCQNGCYGGFMSR